MKLNICFATMMLAVNIANATTMDITEVSIGDFSEFVSATGLITSAEKKGGMVYEGRWVTKSDWNWRKPYGLKADKNEPAVHVTFSEAEQYCAWKGKRLPTKIEWIYHGYTERRSKPTDGFRTGVTYPYPTGNEPTGANCLSDCNSEVLMKSRKTNFSALLNRGAGHSPVGASKRGVNGLYDMGANVWEWAQISNQTGQQATMGGSWWYGASQMKAEYGATKPQDMAVVYIGFRCISE